MFVEATLLSSHYYIVGHPHPWDQPYADTGKGMAGRVITGFRQVDICLSNSMDLEIFFGQRAVTHEGWGLTVKTHNGREMEFLQVERTVGLVLEMDHKTIAVSRTLNERGKFLGVCLSVTCSDQHLLVLTAPTDVDGAFEILHGFAGSEESGLSPHRRIQGQHAVDSYRSGRPNERNIRVKMCRDDMNRRTLEYAPSAADYLRTWNRLV